MTDDLIYLPDLETALGAVYRGPLEEFVNRRDVLVRQLRASKRREDADTAKALRKPSRTAWALNGAVHDDPGPVEHLVATVTAALDAQSGGGDLRTALEQVRASVRALADAAASAASEGGHTAEAATLVPAVMAVISDAGAFAALRAGRLADIPEGGGLDFLTAAPPAGAAAQPADQSTSIQEPDDAGAAEAARAALQQAEARLAAARERTQAAEQTLQDVQARLSAAEKELRRVQDEVNSLRLDLARAREDAKSAAAQQHDAERAVSKRRQ